MSSAPHKIQAAYIHWPFCLSRCPYCDFNAHVWRDIDQSQWQQALLSDLNYAAEHFDRRSINSVFFGGGTPSLMPPATVAAILERIGQLWGYAENPEITLEANPTSAEAQKFTAYATAGVNRISVGVQSLRDDSLKALGRTHTAQEARNAIELARAAVPRISFDLISARPGQTLADWKLELKEALAIGTEHLSIYQLTIEPGTRFAELATAGKLHVPPSDLAADMFEATAELTDQAGLPAYEISNHARPDVESRHNLNYWRGGNWIGIGPGAHGRPKRDGVRFTTESVRDPAAWLKVIDQHGHAFVSAPTAQAEIEAAKEYFMTALRLREGVDLEKFQGELNGPSLPATTLGQLKNEGLLLHQDGNKRLVATEKGRLVLNAILRELLVIES